MLARSVSSTAIVRDFTGAPRKLRLAALAAVLATVLVPIFLSWYDYSGWQLILAMVLLDVCLYPTFRYIARSEIGLPIMPVLCLSFAVQYATPIFTQEAKVELVGNEVFYLENSAMIVVLLITIFSVVVLQLTYYVIRDSRFTRTLPSVRLQLSEERAEIFCVVVFCASLFSGRIQNMLSQETALQFSALFTLLQNQLLVAIAILSWLAFSVRKHKRHTVMLYALVGFTALRGFSTTMLEAMILPLAVLFIGKWTYTRRLPVIGLVAIAMAFLFFSPVKMEIRRVALEEMQARQSTSTADRAVDWVAQASNFWWETISGRRLLSESTADASSRTDLIHEFAEIYTMTPSMVSYQYGATYKYLAVAFVPRVVWPEKPQANYANNFYAIAYGISNEEGIKTSSFGITLLGEGYVNFGAAGSLGTMLFLGLALAGTEHIFGSNRAGVGGQAIFLASFVGFLNGIGTSTELLFGGLVQNLVVCTLLLFWVRSRATGALTQSPHELAPGAMNVGDGSAALRALPIARPSHQQY
jgi:hypothetical protein